MNKWNRNKRKGADAIDETATKSTPKPGDYPIGSVQSRAAARALVQERDKDELVIQIVYVSPDGTKKNGPLIRPNNVQNVGPDSMQNDKSASRSSNHP